MRDFDPAAERAAVIAALCQTHRRPHRTVDLSPAARAVRKPLYARLDAIAAARAERREREREDA